MSNIVRYANSAATVQRGLSPAIWGNASKWIVDAQMGKCAFFMDDFLGAIAIATTTYENGWYGYAGTGCTIAASAARTLSEGEAGLLVMTHDGTDKDNVGMQRGHAGGDYIVPAVSGIGAEAFKLAFECRIKVSTIADDAQAIFAGLGEEAFAADNAKIDDTGVMADKDYIGFQTVHTNGGTTGTNALLTTCFGKASGTQETVQADPKTLVADTWVKLGFIYDPTFPAAKRIKFYVDNVLMSSYVTSTRIADTTDFPGGEELAPLLLSNVGGAATADTLTVDWVACGQYLGSDVS